MDLRWRKSSRSNGGGGGNCVEVADGQRDMVYVRDSKTPSGPVLAFGIDQWRAFVTGARAGVFDS